MADKFRACSVKMCNRSAHWRAGGVRGYCRAHYKRLLRYGSTDGGADRTDNSGTCATDGCERPSRTRGLCNAHYLRMRSGVSAGKAMRGEPERFYQEVVLNHEGDECLIWPFSKTGHGYGRMFSSDGETTIVSRRACEARHGKPPTPKHHAAHSCGNGHLGCVSPRHVSWKEPLENSRDMIAHGTALKKARGEGHPLAKLSESDVREIRARRGERTTKEVAEHYGVKPETIKAIYSRRTWRRLT